MDFDGCSDLIKYRADITRVGIVEGKFKGLISLLGEKLTYFSPCKRVLIP